MDTGTRRHIRGRTILAVAAIVGVLTTAIFIAACTEDLTTTTTTTTTERNLWDDFASTLQVVKLNERSNGKVVTVSPGFLIELKLEGQPSLRFHWDVLPPDPKIVRTLPGPVVVFDDMNLQGTYTFQAIALRVGETTFTADYVNRRGEVKRTFTCTFNVVSSAPTTTTTAGETTSTGAETTTTTEATTTTAAPTTTTTAAPTTTTAAPTTTTTTRPTTTTTAAPTTTSAAPTTTAVAPTTTTVTLPPTTSTSYIERPPVEEQPGFTYLDERNNGEVVNALAGGKIVLSLGANPSTGYHWEIVKNDAAILQPEGEPQFFPQSEALGAPGVMVWTFNVLVADARSSLALAYLDPAGNVDQYFYVGVVTVAAEVVPY